MNAMHNRIMELDLVKHVSNMRYSTVVDIEYQSVTGHPCRAGKLCS